MKNYILAFMLVPFLLFGQKFKNSELIIDNKEGDKNSRSIAVETVPRLLSYQGFLTVGGAGPVSDGQYTVNFRLFDQEEDGNEFWSETHLLTVSDGLVSALLGSNGFPIETVPMNSYLEIEIDGNTLSPRQQITSVMYAIKSDTTYFAKGYTKTADLSQVAMSGEYSDLLNSPDLTPFATKDSLGYYVTLDSLDNYTLTSELSVVAFSGEYEDILNTPDLADFAVTDTLSYYATLDSLGYYVSEDSLSQYIGSTIQAYDSELQQIADLRDLEQGHLIVYDGTQLTWTAQGGEDARSALGLGDMSIQESDSVAITGGSISGIEDLSVSDGGTGASTSEGARDSLGLQIGVDVQGFDSDLQTIATQNHSENPNVKQMLISRGYYWEARTADSARIDLGLKIGQDVQAWNQDLQNYADGQDIPADKVQYGEYFINEPGQQGQIWGSDANLAGRWSNIGDYLTYEVSGADSATSIEFNVDVGTGPNQVIALDVNQKLPAVNASRLEGITADQINDSTVSNSEFNMLAGVRTISGEDGPGGLIQDQLDNKAQKGNNSDILSITGLTTMLAINQGGTGASTAEDARTNLDAQQQNVHLDDLAEDGILSASKVEYGNFFVKDAGDAGFQWTSDGVDEGYWAPGGDIAHVYTNAGRGILINGATVAEAGSVKVEVDAGLAIGQIPQLEFSSNWEGGKLPAVDGSGLLYLNAEQINASSNQPVTNAQFDLLTDLRTTSTADSAGGPIQSQLDNKQNQSIYLDDIITASSGNVSVSDLLIWKVVDGDGSWELLKSDDATYNVTASRVEHGEFFIDDAGINGQYWSSDGAESGGWRTYGPRFTIGADTLNIRTGTNAGDIVELVTGGKLPAVDASLLKEITALQINDSIVSNEEFNSLDQLRLAGESLPEENASEFRFTAGNSIQGQLDGKMNYHANLADLVDGPLTYDLVQYGQYFIQEPSDLDGKVWTWSGDQATGFGLWELPPGAQWLGDLNDASTSPAQSNNLFLGDRSGENASGSDNVGVGSGSLSSITNGTANVAVGKNAGATIQSGNANVLIGNNAGSGLLSNAENKLIIDNGNSNNPLIGGSFAAADRGVSVDGTLLSKEDLSTALDINIVEVNQDNSVVGDLFTISQSSGDVTMNNTSPSKKINFNVDDGTNVLIMDGNDGMVKLPGTVKLASDDDVLTHINATNSGANLNVMGSTKVFVRGGDASAGRIQLMAKDSLRLKSDNIEIDSPQEFIVQNNMRVGGDLRVGDVTNEEFKISHEGGYNTVIENKKDDKDVIFKITPSSTGVQTEVVRLDGDGQSLLMADAKKLEFRDNQTYINSTEANVLALVAPSLNITSTSGVTLNTTNRLQFNDAATYVNSSASNVLDIVSPKLVLSNTGASAVGTVHIGTGDANTIITDATSLTLTSPNLQLNGTTKTIALGQVEFQDSLILADNGSEVNEFVIAENSATNDYTIANMVQDKDIIFNLKPGGTATEIARFDGSASSLLMGGTNKLEFADVNHYINNSGSQLDIVALTSGTVKIGKFTDGDDANTTATVKLEGTTVNPNTNQFTFTAPNETPVVTLDSDKDAVGSSSSLILKKIRGTGGVDDDLLGKIVAKGENDATTEKNYAEIKFESKVATANSERGSILFVTKGTTGPLDINGETDLLMDINHETANTVSVHGDMSVAGSMSLNGAAFRADITSDLKGVNSLGTDGSGEWKDLHLYDASGSGSMVTFGVGSDNASDLRLTYNGSDGLTLNRDNKLLFNTANAYIKSSADRTLDLVAVTDGVNVGKVAVSDGGTKAKMTFAGDNNYISAANANTLALLSPTLNIGSTSTNTYVLGELELQDSLILADNASAVNEFVIAENSNTNDYTIANMVSDKDIIFNLKPSGTATEIARFDGSASSLLMAGTNKIEFGGTTDYINAADSRLNVRSNNPLYVDVSAMKMGNLLQDGESPDYTFVLEKDIDTETLTSSNTAKPVWKLSNTNATAAQAGAIVEFSKTATEDDAIMGSIKSSTGDGAFAQVDFKGEGNTASQTGSMVFTTYESGVAKQVMDLSATNANTVTIGTGSNSANLKVFGTLTAASTAYENDILPANRGGAGVGQEAKEWSDLWLTETGFIYFSNGDGAEDAADVKLTGATAANTGAQAGLILDGAHKFYFDDNTNYDQYIGSEGSGITKLSSVSEVEIDGGSLLDLKADRVTIEAEAEANGMEIKATLGDIALTTSAAGKKVTLNTNAAAVLSHTANGDDQDFTIEQLGVADASLLINSAGTAADAIEIKATAGGIDILASGAAAGEDIDITATGSSVNLSSNEVVADAIKLNASAGGLDIDGVNSTIAITNTTNGDGDDITISTVNANNSSIILTSAGNGTDAIALSAAAGDIDIDAANVTIDATAGVSIQGATASDLTVNGSGETLTLEAAGGGTNKVIISSAGTGQDALDINAPNGGIDIDAAGDKIVALNAGSFNITSNTSNTGTVKVIGADAESAKLFLSADEDDSNADKWLIAAADDGAVTISNTSDGSTFSPKLTVASDGTVTAGSFSGNMNSNDLQSAEVMTIASSNVAAVAVDINASAGGAAIDAVKASNFTVTGSAESLTLSAAGGGAQQVIVSSAGTGENAIQLNATAGGVDIDALAAKDVNIAGGQVALVSKDDAISAISLTTNIGTSETIVVTNTQGNTEDALTLTATAGGVNVDAAAAKDVNIAGGQVAISSKDNIASAITLTANQGAAETIVVTNTQGTEDDALTLTATAGGVDIDAAATKDVNIAGGQVALVSKEDAASAISLTTNIGTSETIVVTNTQGTGSGALTFTATAGGVDIDGADEVNIGSSKDDPAAIVIDASAGGIDILASGAAAGEDIDITASGSSVNISSTEDAANAIYMSANGGTSETIKIHADQGNGAGSIELTSDAGSVDINAASGNVTLDAQQFNITSSSATLNTGKFEVRGAGDGDAAELLISADGTDLDDADQWRITAVDDGNLNIQTKAGGSFANALQIANNGTVTATSFVGNISSNEMTSASNILVKSTNDNADAVIIEADGGVSSGIQLFNDTGAGVGASSSIKVLSDVGGIKVSATGQIAENAIIVSADAGGVDVDAAATKDVNIAGGQVALVSKDAATSAISLTTNIGAAETIVVTNTQGNTEDALTLTATAGGVNVDAAAGKDVDLSGGQVALVSKDDAASAISLTTNVGTSETIVLTNTQGNTATAIHLNAAAGGVTVAANTTLTATGGGVSKFGDDVATLNFDGNGAVTETGMTNVTIDNSGTMTIQGGGVSKYGDDVATLDFDGNGAVTETGMTNVTIDNSGTMTIQGGGASKYGDDVATLDFDGDGAVTETGMTSVGLTPSGAVTLTAGAASTWSTSAGALTIDAAAAKLTLDGHSGIDIAGNGSEIDLTTVGNVVEVNANYLDVKNAAVSAGRIRLYEDSDDGTETLSLQAAAMDASYTLTLPVAAPTADGYVLKSTTDGVTSWSLDLANNSQGTNTNVFGEPANDTDVSFTVDKATNDGIWYWIQASDHFKFADDVVMDGAEKLYFGGTSDYIHLSTNLNSVAAAKFDVDAGNEIILDYGGGDGVIIEASGTVVGSVKKMAATNDIEIKSGATSAIQFTGANVDVRGDLTVTGGNITNALQFDGDVSLEGGTKGLKFVYAGKNTIDIPDNEATSLIIEEDVNSYMTFKTTDNAEEISLSQDTRIIDDKKIEFGNNSEASIEYDADGTSQLRFAGAAAIFEQAVTFSGGISNGGTISTTDIDGGTIDGTVIGATTQAAGDFTAIGAVAPGTIVATTITANAADGGLQFINATKNSIEIPDNKENALIIEEDNAAYMSFDSRNGVEKITFSKPVAFTGGISNPGTVTTTDIDGGTIDGTAIGALSQAAGDFTAIGAVAAGTIVGTTIDATTDFTIGTLVVTDNQIQMTPSTDDVVTIAGATNGILNITTVDDAGTSGDVNLTADGQIEYRANDAAGHIFDIAGTDQLSITDGVIAPVTNNDIALGTTALSYSDLFLADGSVLNLDNGDITLTHSDAKLTLGGDDAVEFDFATHEMTNVDINSGDIDGVRIGYNSGRGGKFTNLWIGGGGSTGDLWLMDADNSNGVSLKGPDDVGSNYSLTFPAADGNANQVLKTDGNGILSWADNASRPVAPGTPNSSSDRRFKKNISTVSGALQKLSKLNPVNYDWRQDEFEHKGFGDKKQWGFIAQEIKEIFPELVGKDDEDFLTLNYQGFVPLLTKAVQEQQEEIDSQQKEIDALKSQLQMIMDMLDNDMSDKTDSKKDNDNKKPVKLSMATQK